TVDSLGLAPTRDAVVVLIDGLGAELIRDHADDAPTLSALTGRVISAGFPATTATSLTSLAVGAPCSQPGVMGYSLRLAPEPRRAGASFNPPAWTPDSSGGPSAIELHPPRTVQTRRSVMELLAADDVEVTYVMREDFRDSGLTRAAFRAEGVYRP